MEEFFGVLSLLFEACPVPFFFGGDVGRDPVPGVCGGFILVGAVVLGEHGWIGSDSEATEHQDIEHVDFVARPDREVVHSAQFIA